MYPKLIGPYWTPNTNDILNLNNIKLIKKDKKRKRKNEEKKMNDLIKNKKIKINNLELNENDMIKIAYFKERLPDIDNTDDDWRRINKDIIINELIEFFQNYDILLLKKIFENLNLTKPSYYPDSFLDSLTSSYITLAIPSNACIVYIENILLKKIYFLKSPASRLLVHSLDHVIKQKPNLMIEYLFIPLFNNSEFIPLSIHQELMKRIIRKSLPKEYLNDLLNGLVKSSCQWNQIIIQVITQILTISFLIHDDIIQLIIEKIEYIKNNNEELFSSILFIKLILTLVTKHPSEILNYINQLEIIILESKNYLSKSVLNSIKIIKKKNNL